MKVLTAIATILLSATLTYAEQDKAPSKEMQEILDERSAVHSQLRTSGLKKLHYEDLQELDKLVKFEKYKVPHPIAADSIEYEVWRSIETGSYIILKTGGEQGLLEVYGVGVPKKKVTRAEPNGA